MTWFYFRGDIVPLKDWLFGKDKKTKKEKEAQAIASLKKQLNRYELESQNLLRKIEEQRNYAKQLIARGNKKGAAAALKRAKIYEKRYNQIQNTMMNLGTMIDNIQQAKSTAETVKAMEVAGEVIDQTIEEVPPEKTEEIMMKMEEQREKISMMTESISDPDFAEMELDFDDLEDVDSELEMLELEVQKGQVGELPTPTATTTPSASPVMSTGNEEKEDSSDVESELEKLKKELEENK